MHSAIEADTQPHRSTSSSRGAEAQGCQQGRQPSLQSRVSMASVTSHKAPATGSGTSSQTPTEESIGTTRQQAAPTASSIQTAAAPEHHANSVSAPAGSVTHAAGEDSTATQCVG